MYKPFSLPLLAVLSILICSSIASAHNAEYVTVSGNRFVLAQSHQIFVPWGNDESYDENDIPLARDNWPKVVANFTYLKSIDTNTVRIFPQFGEIMGSTPTSVNADNLHLLAKIVDLADSLDMRVDITGLDVRRPFDRSINPPWYDKLSDTDRWAAQALYWSSVAQTVMRCEGKNAVFCYDLTNEPNAPGSDTTTLYMGTIGDNYYDQSVVRHIDDPITHQPRTQVQIAQHWIQNLTAAIHKYDREHLITVGTLSRQGFYGAFIPQSMAPYLDFFSTHIYPSAGKVSDAVDEVNSCVTGKPILIEETFNLDCDPREESQFLLRSDFRNGGNAAGFIGHFNGITIDEYNKMADSGKRTIGDGMEEEWLLLSQCLSDLGFEIPALPAGMYRSNPDGSPWRFAGNSGVSANDSALTSGNPNAPDGNQVAFLLAPGKIDQSLYLEHGKDYMISFMAAYRKDHTEPKFTVTWGSVQIGSPFTPDSTAYKSYQTIPFNIGDNPSGFYDIAFVSQGAGDGMAFIDTVRIAAR